MSLPPHSRTSVGAAMARRWQQFSEGLPRPFWALVIATIVTRLGAFIVPLLFAYLSQVRHLSLTNAGRVVALFGVGSFIGTLLGGVCADRFGRRWTMIVAVVLDAIFIFLIGQAVVIWALALTTFLAGLAADAFRPAGQAMVSDIVEDKHRKKAFAIEYWAINLGFALSAGIGGTLASKHFPLLFVLDSATTLTMGLILFLAVPESRSVAAEQSSERGSMLTPFLDKRFAPFLVLNLFTTVVFFQHLVGLIEDLRVKGFGTREYGLAISLNGLMIVLLQGWIIIRLQKVRDSRLLSIASALIALGIGTVAFAKSMPGYWASVAVWTLGEILLTPASSTLVARAAPVGMQGRYQGAYFVTWSLGAVLAPIIGPPLIEHFGLSTYWASCTAIGLVPAVGHLIFSRTFDVPLELAKTPATE